MEEFNINEQLAFELDIELDMADEPVKGLNSYELRRYLFPLDPSVNSARASRNRYKNYDSILATSG
jgi:hypothetical protein